VNTQSFCRGRRVSSLFPRELAKAVCVSLGRISCKRGPGYSRPVLTADLVRLYPTLFHTAADGSWPSIREHGLLSTAALLDRWEVAEPTRHELLTTVRGESTVVEHPVHGTAVVRDQGPIHEPSLEAALTDLSVEQWLQRLNERVFFFLQRSQVDALVTARRYRAHPSLVISVDTASLIAAYESQIELCRINSGFAQRHSKSPRGSGTFMSIAAYPHPQRKEPVRADRPDVKELTVIGGVPDIVRHVTRVQRIVGGEVVEHLVI
jgi:hypothetical protein